MTHTVVRLTNAEVTSEVKADKLVNRINKELEDRDYAVRDKSIGDATDLNGDIILRCHTDHKLVSEADSWCNFLKKFVESNLARKQEDGEGFISAVVDEHDCQHMEGKQTPCKPVEWKIE